MTKKDELQVLNEKYESAVVKANRFDIFKIMEKINKRRKKKRDALAEKLEFRVVEPDDEFEVDEWSPRIPKEKKRKK